MTGAPSPEAESCPWASSEAPPPLTSVVTFRLKIGLEQKIDGEWSGYAV